MDLKRLFSKALRRLLNPPSLTKCKLLPHAKICSGTQANFTRVERYSYVGHNCFMLNADIGRFCSIADNCRIGGASHPIDRVSTSPVFHEGKNVMKKNFALFSLPTVEKTVINDDVWLGAGVIVKSGVSIGCGSVVGAGSVVVHDIPPYEIWAGNPARKIRDRFNSDVAAKLKEIAWWTWDDRKIADYASYFDDPISFIEAIEAQEKC